MKQGLFRIEENRPLTASVSLLRLRGDVSAAERPGQFAALRIPGFYLRRPLSVCDKDDECLSFLYEAAGPGTETLRSLAPGAELDLLTGLGNGFDLRLAGFSPLLIGGGTGLSPLYWLARELLSQGAQPTLLLGFPRAEDVFFEEEFKALGLETVVCTEDGSRGLKGYVTEAMDRPHTAFYACGPEAMLRAVCRRSDRPGQLSFDRRMGCGFGACMGCSVQTAAGPKRICREGPVLDRREVLWED